MKMFTRLVRTNIYHGVRKLSMIPSSSKFKVNEDVIIIGSGLFCGAVGSVGMMVSEIDTIVNIEHRDVNCNDLPIVIVAGMAGAVTWTIVGVCIGTVVGFIFPVVLIVSIPACIITAGGKLISSGQKKSNTTD